MLSLQRSPVPPACMQSQGTPVGESSKIVLKLSFKKIKELKAAMAGQQDALITKERTVKELQAAATALEASCMAHQATIAGLEAKLGQVRLVPALCKKGSLQALSHGWFCPQGHLISHSLPGWALDCFFVAQNDPFLLGSHCSPGLAHLCS
jgi:hypothetical protein